MNRIFHGAHLQALQVLRGFDVTFAVGHVAYAVFTPSQRLETFGIKLGEHVLANRAIEHGARMGLVAEQKGHVQNFGFRDKIGNRTRRRKRQLLCAELNRFNRLALATECAAVEGLYFVTPSGASFDFFGKRVNGDTLMGVLRHRDADTHGGLCACRSNQPQAKGHTQNQF